MRNEAREEVNTRRDADVVRIGDMTLKRVSVIRRTKVNAVWGCRDMSAVGRPYYTLLIVTDREVARTLVSVFSLCEKETERPAYLRSFLWGEHLCYLFPYRRERLLSDFAAGQITDPRVSEIICVNLLLTCMESPLPYPLLSLGFAQGMIHVETDNSVYLTSDFDLTALDPSVTESDCVVGCARIMLDVLGMNRKKQLKSRKLLSKKVEREAYTQFSEAYHDFKLTISDKKKRSALLRFFGFFAEHKDRIFKIVLVFSIACFILALAMLISYLIFGDFALAKIFGHNLNMIGTEHLNER
ncbi:MAG: hypothetical protein LBL63_01655 [Clostridiales Family XIII bacterium]|jgi:hypothetical protein|nr:hypothetical protein [Clostridiales Family XIII bacterium]